MSTKSIARLDSVKVVPLTTKTANTSELRQRYESSEIPFYGTEGALYERRLVFDRAIHPKAPSVRERVSEAQEIVNNALGSGAQA